MKDMASWQPQEEPLRQLSSCLKDSLSGHNKNAQKQAETVSISVYGICSERAAPAYSRTSANLGLFN